MKKIVTLSGGSGGFILLSGLAEYAIDITSIATVFDSGGSTGVLRDAYGALPQGDLRRCLLALTPNSSEWRKPFMRRQKEKGFLEGHPLGNLMLFAFEEDYGRADASKVLGKLMHTRGTVLPVSIDDAHLVATLSDGSEVFSESAIDTRVASDNIEIVRMRLDRPATATRSAIDAITASDYIIIGPGDLYTSLIPNLLAEGVTEAINASSAPIIYVANFMTKASETRGYTLERFLESLRAHGISRPITYVVHTHESIAPELLNVYREKEGAEEVVSANTTTLRSYCEHYHLEPLQSERAAREGIIRHSSHKLGRALMDIIEERHTARLLIIDLDDTLIQTTLGDKKFPGAPEKISLTPGALEFLHAYQGKRSLLTVGDVELQNRKVDALGLSQFIDEQFVCSSPEGKFEIMRFLVKRTKSSKDVLVVGDRVDSELHFAQQLGCTVVRICLPGGKYAKQSVPLNEKIACSAADFTTLMHFCSSNFLAK